MSAEPRGRRHAAASWRPLRFPPQLSDGTVLVRQLRESDAPAYAAAFQADPDLGRLLGVPHDPEADWVRAAAERARAGARAGRWLELVVCDATDDHDRGELLGAVGLTDFSRRHRRCELGYWLVPAGRGRGLATRACALVIDWLFGEYGLARIEITATAENIASHRVAERLGFAREALRRQRDVERGRRVDIVQFGLLQEEWRSRGG